MLSCAFSSMLGCAILMFGVLACWCLVLRCRPVCAPLFQMELSHNHKEEAKLSGAWNMSSAELGRRCEFKERYEREVSDLRRAFRVLEEKFDARQACCCLCSWCAVCCQGNEVRLESLLDEASSELKRAQVCGCLFLCSALCAARLASPSWRGLPPWSIWRLVSLSWRRVPPRSIVVLGLLRPSFLI